MLPETFNGTFWSDKNFDAGLTVKYEYMFNKSGRVTNMLSKNT
jgi:hypothetical protein